MNKEELLNQLNTSQREAVEYNDGPLLVIAGAGSGKTRVLTYKIAYLIQLGLKPWNILALTFTNKAANEMKARIGKIVGTENAQPIYMGTFHSIFSRILRQEAEHIGFTPQFTIYDESDSRSLIKSIVKEMGLDDKTYKPSTVHNRISMAKNHIINSMQYINDPELFERDRIARMPAIGKIYVTYQQRCQKANAMDFDDLLMLIYQLFCNHEDVRRKWAERFQYILVDEYQDTNRVQQMIVEQLSREHKRVCVVGDDAQSIYAFRGANIDNILDFNNVYPNAKLFKLEQNYRSTQRIVQAANSLIKRNTRQIPKEVFSENDEGECLVLKTAYSDKEEASIVCKDIKRIKHDEECEYSDFAILYRTNAQSRSFEEECLRQGIPYRIFGGLSFYQRKEIKDIIAYFRLVSNLNDEEAFKRIINYPARGIGDTTLANIADSAQRFDASFWNVAVEPDKYQLQVNAGTKTKLQAFTSLILGFTEKLQTTDAYALGREIIQDSGISADLFSSTDPEYITRQENIEEFMAALQDFVEEMCEEGREEEALLSTFLQEISLQTDKESDDGKSAKVSMMTIHAAKGLEFPTVFVVGMEENIFPSPMAQTMRELEEERRLLYVAITRAERNCILTCAKNRWRYGKLEFDVPSRFLREIDNSYMRIEGGIRVSEKHESPFHIKKPWDNEYPEYDSRAQNSRPVASQFRADVDYKVTRPQRPESTADPLSPAFRRQLDVARQNKFTPKGAQAAGFRQAAQQPPSHFKRVNTSAPPAGAAPVGVLQAGMTIEHQRFGMGTVVSVEGAGDNAKATVEFRNTGTKQLLLKFAKFKIIY